MSDPTFGEIRYQKAGFWEGRVIFSPLNSSVEVLIDGNEAGPSPEQREFLSRLEKVYETANQEATEKLNEAASASSWSHHIMSTDLKLETIDIPLSPEENGQWAFTYLHVPTDSHCQVHFEKWKVFSVEIEPC